MNMGSSKTTIFNQEVNEVAAFAKALAHPARVAIIKHLLERQSCVCGDLVIEIGLAQATISQHLKALKQAGIIKGTIEGTSTCYCIDENQWSRLKEQLLTELLNCKHQSKNCC